MTDKIEVEILEDGQVKEKTEDFSDFNHMSADELLDMLDDYIGGEVTVKKNEDTAGARFFAKKKVLRGGKIVSS
jgi:hypothetical protein